MKKDLKSEIKLLIDQAPESELEAIYRFLKPMAEASDKDKFSRNLEKIISEDKKLLERLAQ